MSLIVGIFLVRYPFKVSNTHSQTDPAWEMADPTPRH
jgi:hypothetical protein